MTSQSDSILVKSHVGRDLLQSAGLFRNEARVVWEYVSNSLQYVDPGTAPVARVTLDTRRKRIAIADNGRGMDWRGLQNFFLMHGENTDRKEGRPGRGLFGTGKSAAFGIADLLRITTVRDGRRSKVELTREAIQAMGSGDPIPVRQLEREASSELSNSTFIEIEGVHLKSLDQARVIQYIERHLARWPKNATVYVNNHECEYTEPPVASEARFRPTDPDLTRLGDVELVIKVSRAPLDEDLRGVAVYAKGVWLETTLAGSEGREMAGYIFGEFDVPGLDDDSSAIPAFDMSRSGHLNPANELVQAVYAFVGQKVELVRRGLVEQEKRRKATEDARKLAEEAAQIARAINDDFESFRQQVAKVRARSRGSVDAGPALDGTAEQDNDLLFGSDVPATVVCPTGNPGHGEGSSSGGSEPPNMAPEVSAGPPESEKKGRPGGGAGDRARTRGGFQVTFASMGVESYRAKYVRDERTIFINLDHPQLVSARGLASVEDPVFRRLAYEVAFSEYAIALASEMAQHDEYLDISDPIVAIRETINRIARRSAHLYSQ